MQEETFTDTKVVDSSQQAVDVQTPRFNNIILILIGICVIVLLLLILIAYFMLSKKSSESGNKFVNNPELAPTATPTLHFEDLLRPPELYPDFKWEETSPIISFNGPLIYVDYEPLTASISGKEWRYEAGKFDDFKTFNQVENGFRKYYSEATNKLGWQIETKRGGKRLEVLTGDGPGGSIWGYTKISGDKMRVIMLQTFNDEGVRLSPGCPCKLSFSVFVSDIFSTAELND